MTGHIEVGSEEKTAWLTGRRKGMRDGQCESGTRLEAIRCSRTYRSIEAR